MASNFSGALKLVNLNDYIGPSQSCVVTSSAAQKGKAKGVARTEAEDAPVRVTLHDCLACSGCVTSAEAVMLEHQSAEELLARLAEGEKAVIVSLSPQSRASLATHYGLSPLRAFQKLTAFFKSLGARAVFDTSASRDLALIEACEEFVGKFRARRAGDSSELPLLASACPGWVCYAEKTHGADVLPHISTVKSPQQAMGAVLKRHAWRKLGLRPEAIHHVTIMPCYDKKLEASRDDFLFPGDGVSVAEVDSVLTSGEVLELLEKRGVDFPALEDAPLDRLLTNSNEEGMLYGVRGGSGGYVDTIFRYAAKTLFGKDVGDLEFKTMRNSDFKVVTLEDDVGKVVLRFACAYGFRNIQTLVRKIKLGKCEYDFVEIMACPSGCLNGGGQVKPKSGQSAKELIQALEDVYLQELEVKDPFHNPVARGVYEEWLGHPRSAEALKVLHTSYHSVEKTIVNQEASKKVVQECTGTCIERWVHMGMLGGKWDVTSWTTQGGVGDGEGVTVVRDAIAAGAFESAQQHGGENAQFGFQHVGIVR